VSICTKRQFASLSALAFCIAIIVAQAVSGNSPAVEPPNCVSPSATGQPSQREIAQYMQGVADEIFRGRVTSVDKLYPQSSPEYGDGVRVTFDVDTVWKGDVSPIIVVVQEPALSRTLQGCDIWLSGRTYNFREDLTYLIYAKKDAIGGTYRPLVGTKTTNIADDDIAVIGGGIPVPAVRPVLTTVAVVALPPATPPSPLPATSLPESPGRNAVIQSLLIGGGVLGAGLIGLIFVL
jgi:hypothetical protein